MDFRHTMIKLGVAWAIILLFGLLIHTSGKNEAVLRTFRLHQHKAACGFVLKRMPNLADSIDAMQLVNECDYTRDSLLPLVRGDALRDLPEQR